MYGFCEKNKKPDGSKYDIYQDYVASNPYPAKTLNEDIEQWMAPRLDRFVLSKRVLHPLIEQGVKDV